MKRFTILLLGAMASIILAEWSYSGNSGPNFWSVDYPTCAKAQQSPVQILHEEAEPVEIDDFRFHGYDNTRTLDNLTVWNDGYTVTVRVHGDLNIDGGGLEGMYSLHSFHFHWASTDRAGSEHWLDGQAFPLEMHLVHKSVRHNKIQTALEDPTGLAVLGIFAKVGNHHPYFQAIIDNLRLLDIGDYANVRPFPLSGLLPVDTEAFYRYSGSLTTPPCSESVVWSVFREPIEISEEQIRQVRILSKISNITENYRPIQELNGRRIVVRKKSAALFGSRLQNDSFYQNGNSASGIPLSSFIVAMISVLNILLARY